MIYCKLPGKRARPLGGDFLVFNRIHAEIFTVETAEDRAKLDRELAHLQANNPGEFTLRKVS